MEFALRFTFGIAVIVAVVAGGAWICWRLLKSSVDPAALLFRWIITIVVLGGGYFFINWIIGPNAGGLEKIVGVFAGMFLGLTLAFIWGPAIIDKVSDAIGSLFTGGSEPPVPEPFYSIAISK